MQAWGKAHQAEPESRVGTPLHRDGWTRERAHAEEPGECLPDHGDPPLQPRVKAGLQRGKGEQQASHCSRPWGRCARPPRPRTGRPPPGQGSASARACPASSTPPGGGVLCSLPRRAAQASPPQGGCFTAPGKGTTLGSPRAGLRSSAPRQRQCGCGWAGGCRPSPRRKAW